MKGTRGSTPRSATPRYGARAEATAVPVRTSVESQGMLGVAACRESSAHGGERSADEVSAHIAMATSSTFALAPAYGSVRKAKADSTAPATIQPPKRP